jgi:hypothetical protein
MALLLLIEFKERHGKRMFAIVDAQPMYVKWAYYYGIMALFLLFGVFHHRAQFIYFQF